METQYYFRFIVWHNVDRQFTEFEAALKYSKTCREKIHLSILHKNNSCSEVYDEQIVSSPEEIEPAKIKLIESFNKLIA